MQRLLKSGMILSLLTMLVLLSTSIGAAAPGPADKSRASARAHLKAQAARYGLPADLAGLADGDLVTSVAGTHVRFQQTVGAVPVDGAVINVSLDGAN
ncbi:MAG TPA: hypothetical protein VD886_02070, partial [Herpetosiphonaceae bacterium]|nr:hypothetical protein [Herpetosiphonaceae bacterium]